jgi:hypothetical protein
MIPMHPPALRRARSRCCHRERRHYHPGRSPCHRTSSRIRCTRVRRRPRAANPTRRNQINSGERTRTYTDVFSLVWQQLWLVVQGDAPRRTGVDGARLPCKRAVVSSMLTGGSARNIVLAAKTPSSRTESVFDRRARCHEGVTTCCSVAAAIFGDPSATLTEFPRLLAVVRQRSRNRRRVVLA